MKKIIVTLLICCMILPCLSKVKNLRVSTDNTYSFSVADEDFTPTDDNDDDKTQTI